MDGRHPYNDTLSLIFVIYSLLRKQVLCCRVSASYDTTWYLVQEEEERPVFSKSRRKLGGSACALLSLQLIANSQVSLAQASNKNYIYTHGSIQINGKGKTFGYLTSGVEKNSTRQRKKFIFVGYYYSTYS